MLLAVFTIIFGTRHLDASERGLLGDMGANAAGALGAFDSGCKVCGTGGANCRCDQCPAPTSCNACKLPLSNDCRLPNGDMVLDLTKFDQIVPDDQPRVSVST